MEQMEKVSNAPTERDKIQSRVKYILNNPKSYKSIMFGDGIMMGVDKYREQIVDLKSVIHIQEEMIKVQKEQIELLREKQAITFSSEEIKPMSNKEFFSKDWDIMKEVAK